MQHILNLIRGALIGAAELSPGISGGTVALIIGIYERALHNADKIVKRKFAQVEWLFIAFIGLGMVAAVFGLSGIISTFVAENFSLSHSLFAGMVLISVWVPFSMIDKQDRRNPKYYLFALASAVFIFIVTGFTSNQVEDPNLFFVFLDARGLWLLGAVDAGHVRARSARGLRTRYRRHLGLYGRCIVRCGLYRALFELHA